MNKNLSYCPRPNKFNKKTLNDDLNKFYRSIKLKSTFEKKNQTTEEKQNDNNPQNFRYKRNTSWSPPYVHPNVITFIDAVNKDIENSTIKKLPKDNLSKDERNALHSLQTRDDIIITNADKGGAVVIWGIEDYLKEAYKQLGDSKFYKKFDHDPTDNHKATVIRVLQELNSKGILSKELTYQLTPDKVRTPTFYLLPKIHKQGNPGRPVISSLDCHTSNISAFIANVLQPEVEKLDSYVKDTTDFINKIKGKTIPAGAFLVTLDVKSLYTNIPHDEGILAVEKALTGKFPNTFIQAIKDMLLLVLSLNNFSFNGEHFLQILGCAMGTICAPPYANTFMGEFEHVHIYPLIRNLNDLYLRFIDDIFLIWTGTTTEFEAFITRLNELHPSIKFDYEISRKETNFLDTTVYIDNNNVLGTKVYNKPTDRKNFLHRKSEHPKHTKINMPYGQALRGKRICSTNDDFEVFCSDLMKSFISRGYKKEEVKPQIERAKAVDRSTTLQLKQKKSNNRATMVTTFNRTLPNLNEVLNRNWNLLNLDPELAPIFKEQPLIAFKRNRNLFDMLGSRNIVNSKVKRSTKPILEVKRCSPCTEDHKNACCRQLCNTTTFKNNVRGTTFKIYHETNCKSTMVIYLLECTLCRLQYVGKSETPMHHRITTHRSHIKNHPNPIPVDKHFQDAKHDFNVHGSFTIIEQLTKPKEKEDARELLRSLEDRWMLRLNTIQPSGLNEKLNSKSGATGVLRL